MQRTRHLPAPQYHQRSIRSLPTRRTRRAPFAGDVLALPATGGTMSERSARGDGLSEAFARVQAAARHGPWHSARQQDWKSILSTHPDLIDLDLHAARWYPDAEQ